MNRNIKLIRSFLASLAVLAIVFSCRKNRLEPSWDTKMLVPLATSSLKISNLVKDTSLVKQDNDGLLSIAYSNEVYALENPLDSMVSLLIAPFKEKITLQSIALGEQKINQSYKLGDLIAQLPAAYPKPSDGSNLPAAFMPLINQGLAGVTNSSSKLDLSEFLVEAFPKQMLFDINIENHTSFDIVGLEYEIKNTVSGVVLVQDVIPLISAQTTYEKLDRDLMDQIGNNAVTGFLTVSYGGFQLQVPSGQTSSKINYSDYLALNAKIHSIEVIKAKAQFPAQEVINSSQLVDVYADNQVELKFARIQEGVVNVKSWSSIPTDIFFTYTVPNLSTNGKNFSFSSSIDDSYSSSQNAKDTNFLFNNYEFDFTVNKAPHFKEFNGFVNDVVGYIDSTKGIIELSLEDTVSLDIQVTKIKPSYVRGYLGSSVEHVKEKIKVDVFKNASGKINFEKVELSMSILNDIGVNAMIQIYSIKARNTTTGATEEYLGGKGPFIINRATESGLTYNRATSSIVLDNAANLLSILPDEFEIDMELYLNPNGNDLSYQDFIHSGASVKAILNINIPLSGSVDSLTLQSYNPVDFENINVPEGFKEGIVSLVIENGFPLEASLEVSFVNNSGAVIRSLITNDKITAATLDPLTKKVIANSKQRFDFVFDNFELNSLSSTQQLQVKAVFDTANKSVKIYDSYTLDVQVVADFGYQIKVGK